jgi:hypothetical protein
MKIRAFVLLSCMLLVPGAAMFSHHIPASFRTTLRTQVWGPAIDTVASSLGLSAATATTAAAAPLQTGSSGVVAAPATPVQAMPTVVLAPHPESQPAGVRVQTGPLWSPVSGTADMAGFRHDAEDQLAKLGAVAFECTASSDGGLHRCSCRVAADPSGQLQRVFHAAASDPRSAIQNLVGQVISWKERLAGVPPPTQSGRSGDPVRLQ